MPAMLHVVKRDGKPQNVMFDKITSRISKLCYNLNMEFVDPASITMKVVGNLFPGISTTDLDNLTADTAASMFNVHEDYIRLAARIVVSNLHKDTEKMFSSVIDKIANAKTDGIQLRLISKDMHRIVMDNANKLNSCIVHDRDYLFTYCGFKYIESAYLTKINGKVVERPQHMFLRVALAIHLHDIDAAIETYNYMSGHWFIHGTSTLYNAGKCDGSLANSYLVSMQDDSIIGIYNTLAQCAEIMKESGGLGLNIHCIRCKGSPIVGTNGESTGIVPMLRVYNSTIKYTDLISARRPGAICIYIEPWHPDILEYVGLNRNYGAEELRARDLSYAIWVPDLFMQRVESGQDWTLMCPRDCPGLENTHGDEFKQLYERYENEGKGRKVIQAQRLWYLIVESQIETGSPLMAYKDSCNAHSNQQNIGPIKSSSLYGELMQYSSDQEIGVGHLASIALPKFVVKQSDTAQSTTTHNNDDKDNGVYIFDFEELIKVTGAIVNNLNKIIDSSGYCLEEAKSSAFRHRPIGIGVQGLADVFAKMRYPFDSEDAKNLNKMIFETIYYGALRSSCELAKANGPYETYQGSPLSKGFLQFDLWNVSPICEYDWKVLRENIKSFGIRNSVLIAISPTSMTSKILGNSAGVDPYESMLNRGQLNSNNLNVINSFLVNEMRKSACWNDDVKRQILAANGSIQSISSIPKDIRAVYKTCWEISQKSIIDMAADRAPFIDQSQSITIYIKDTSYAKISSMHFYAWKKGLKTGMTRLKTKM
ncbi:hypothetical protein GJ496_002428 [Pomphorhynchus laevis]|nr:hypothetical protein GJ496_002428 [Pomphorhynchus laevis]